MKYKAAICLSAAMLSVMPVSSAYAWGPHDRWGHGGPLVGIIALGAAAVVGTAAILTAPVNALAAAAPPAYYPPQQPAYAPPQAYYAPQPAYYARPAYYAAPPAYYAQAPAYYAPAPAYYYGR
jgi:hypothetical protein